MSIKNWIRSVITRITAGSIYAVLSPNIEAQDAKIEAQNVQIDALYNQIDMLRREMLVDKFSAERATLPIHSETSPKLVEGAASLSIDDAFHALKQLQPRAYPIWRVLFDNGLDSYTNDMSNNCLTEGHRYEKAFDFFSDLFLHGNVLDIGCGPQSVPSYLRNYPVKQIFGLDPLLPFEEHPFTFMQGFCEFIPWEDEQFDCVTTVTSLDHVLDLDKSISEIYRVLRKGGYFIAWIGAIPGAKPYDPNAADLKAIDACHIFHFDAPWFEELISKHFTLKARYYDMIGNYFYCYVK